MQGVQELFRLDGRVAIITGGYGGIGVAVTRGLAAAGASVVVAGHNRGRASQFAAEIAGQGGRAIALEFEATSAKSINSMVAGVVAQLGRVDILVNTVGVNREQKALEVTEDAFAFVFDVNTRSAMFQSQAVARQMIAQGSGGKIIHFGSVRSQLALRGRGYAAYCASKGGLPILAKQLAAEFAPERININVLAPTFVRTEQAAPWLNNEDFRSALEARIPLGRIAEPEDMIGAVLFFSSPASDYITGQTLYLDGGITATQ
jgi:gluconate 5-dehydrogenase